GAHHRAELAVRAARDLGDFLEHHVHVPEALPDPLHDEMARRVAESRRGHVAHADAVQRLLHDLALAHGQAVPNRIEPGDPPAIPTVSLIPYVSRPGHPNAAALVSRSHSGNGSALVIATRIVTSPRPRRRTSCAKAYSAEG